MSGSYFDRTVRISKCTAGSTRALASKPGAPGSRSGFFTLDCEVGGVESRHCSYNPSPKLKPLFHEPRGSEYFLKILARSCSPEQDLVCTHLGKDCGPTCLARRVSTNVAAAEKPQTITLLP